MRPQGLFFCPVHVSGANFNVDENVLTVLLIKSIFSVVYLYFYLFSMFGCWVFLSLTLSPSLCLSLSLALSPSVSLCLPLSPSVSSLSHSLFLSFSLSLSFFFSLMVDSLGYFSFQPVPHDCYNKRCSMCYSICGMVHIKYPLLLIKKSSHFSGRSRFPLSHTLCPVPYNHK